MMPVVVRSCCQKLIFIVEGWCAGGNKPARRVSFKTNLTSPWSRNLNPPLLGEFCRHIPFESLARGNFKSGPGCSKHD